MCSQLLHPGHQNALHKFSFQFFFVSSVKKAKKKFHFGGVEKKNLLKRRMESLQKLSEVFGQFVFSKYSKLKELISRQLIKCFQLLQIQFLENKCLKFWTFLRVLCNGLIIYDVRTKEIGEKCKTFLKTKEKREKRIEKWVKITKLEKVFKKQKKGRGSKVLDVLNEPDSTVIKFHIESGYQEFILKVQVSIYNRSFWKFSFFDIVPKSDFIFLVGLVVHHNRINYSRYSEWILCSPKSCYKKKISFLYLYSLF